MHGHDIRLKKIGYHEEVISKLLEFNKVVLRVKSLNEVNIFGNKTQELRKSGTEVIDLCELGKLACCNLAESLENTNTVDVNYSDGITGGREIQMLGLAGSYSAQIKPRDRWAIIAYIRAMQETFGKTAGQAVAQKEAK